VTYFNQGKKGVKNFSSLGTGPSCAITVREDHYCHYYVVMEHVTIQYELQGSRGCAVARLLGAMLGR
jgi:hypothetical protein